MVKSETNPGISLQHESAISHVTGQSVYINDMPINDQMLAGRVVYSKFAHAAIKSFNLDKARNYPGVRAVLIEGLLVLLVQSDVLGGVEACPIRLIDASNGAFLALEVCRPVPGLDLWVGSIPRQLPPVRPGDL